MSLLPSTPGAAVVKIDRAGLPFIALAALPSAVALAARRWRRAVVLAVVPAAVAAFFRDPDRRPDLGEEADPDLVVAPADGKVMHVGEPQVDVAPPGDWQQISIFLALTDVHINRAPYGGRVIAVDHRPGRYLAAFKPESAHENERSELTVVSEVAGVERTVVFRQIVGMAARRVVTRVTAGESLRTGQRIGLMKFGSRMDVFVPPGVEILVSLGQRTRAGETALARWPESS